jgi:hypothetical protein
MEGSFKMKVVRTDNYDREIYDEILIAKELSKDEAEKVARDMNNSNDQWFYKVVGEDYKLFKFEP